jgi:hypothetical protein
MASACMISSADRERRRLLDGRVSIRWTGKPRDAALIYATRSGITVSSTEILVASAKSRAGFG